MKDSQMEVMTALFGKIDAQTEIPAFHRQWQAAVRAAASPKPVTGRGDMVRRTVWRWLSAPVVIAVAMASALTFVISGLWSVENVPEAGSAIETAMTYRAQPPMDPNLPWVAPTDELLSANVRRYEVQWFTHAVYDPLTMEVR